MQAKIYHNPRCSKSRQALQLLKENNIEPQIIKYLETPPDHNELKEMLQLLDLKPLDIIRFKDKKAKELGISHKDDRKPDAWIDLMVMNPALIERPIVVINGRAVMGRPPEKVLDIL